MARNKQKAEIYIEGRIRELLHESTKCNNKHDQMWYNRVAQELQWALEMHTGKMSEDCVIAEYQEELF